MIEKSRMPEPAPEGYGHHYMIVYCHSTGWGRTFIHRRERIAKFSHIVELDEMVKNITGITTLAVMWFIEMEEDESAVESLPQAPDEEKSK